MLRTIGVCARMGLLALGLGLLPLGAAGGAPDDLDTAAGRRGQRAVERLAKFPATQVVHVDLGSTTGPVTYRASGFLWAMTADEPAQEYVAPLEPRLFRAGPMGPKGAFATYRRVRALGARFQLVISDLHGYKPARGWPGDKGNWRRWDTMVEEVVRRARESGYRFEWDIWNEPNSQRYWGRSRAQFAEMWRRTVIRIRRMDRDAVIVGPSLDGYNPKLLRAFLVYAHRNRVLPTVLSWHEFSSDKGGYKQIPAHVEEMRRFMRRNRMPVLPITINEAIGANLQNQPGATVWFLAMLESAKVHGACHACWDEGDSGVNNCRTPSLNGLLTPDTLQPRSTWWAYKGYADITGRLVRLRPSRTVGGVAGVNPDTPEARVLLGRDGGQRGNVVVRLSGLDRVPSLVEGERVRVVAERIPASGWDHLPRPVPVIDRRFDVEGGKLEVALPDFGPADAYTVRVSRPGS